MFEKMKQLMQLKSQMAEIKKRLDEMVIKTTSSKGNIEITISGSQEIKEVAVLADINTLAKEDLSKEIKEAVNKAIKESQAAAAKTMGSLAGLGNLGL